MHCKHLVQINNSCISDLKTQFVESKEATLLANEQPIVCGLVVLNTLLKGKFKLPIAKNKNKMIWFSFLSFVDIQPFCLGIEM